MNGRKDAVTLLLSAGADVSITNELGQTAAKVAVLGGHTTIVKLLDGHGETAS